jgi:hypothetical protein
VFDLYPRHSHRTPQQIAEDTGGTFEPMRQHRRADDHDSDTSAAHGAATHGAATHGSSVAEPKRKEDVSQTR